VIPFEFLFVFVEARHDEELREQRDVFDEHGEQQETHHVLLCVVALALLEVLVEVVDPLFDRGDVGHLLEFLRDPQDVE